MSDSAAKTDDKQGCDHSGDCLCVPIVEKFNFAEIETKVSVTQVEPPAGETETQKETRLEKKCDDMQANRKQKKEDGKRKEANPSVDKTPEETTNATATAGAVAPAEAEPKPKEEEDQQGALHYGGHSLVPTDVIHIDFMTCGSVIGQDVIAKIASAIVTLRRRMSWDNADRSVIFSDRITWNRAFTTPTTWATKSSIIWLVRNFADPVNTQIEYVQPFIKTKFKMHDTAGVLANGLPNIKGICDTLKANAKMSKNVADKMCSSITRNPEVYDISGFFANGYCLAAHLDYCTASGVEFTWQAVDRDLLIFANINSVTDDAANAAVKLLNLGLNEQALAFHFRRLSPNDLQTIISIAMGGISSLTIPAGAANFPVTTLIKWPTRKYLFWDTTEQVFPARAVLTAEQVRQSLANIACLLGAYDDMARGFVKAASIVYCSPRQWELPTAPKPVMEKEPASLGKVTDCLKNLKTPGNLSFESASLLASKAIRTIQVKEGTADGDQASLEFVHQLLNSLNPIPPSQSEIEQRKAEHKRKLEEWDKQRKYSGGLIHAMLEISNIQVQEVRGHNVLWDILNIKRPTDAIDNMTYKDGLCLAGMKSTDQMNAMLTIGALLSVSAGTVLHNLNITGRELNLWARGDGPRITVHMRELFSATRAGSVAPFYQMVTGAFQQMVEAKLSPTFMRRCSVFSRFTTEIPHVRLNNSWWVGTWGMHIPYIADPINLSWAYIGFVDVWGYFGPNPKVNFSHDIVIGGADNNEFIGFHRDEPKYLEQASMDSAFGYIVYGPMMTNVTTMLIRPRHNPVITFREIKLARAGAGELQPPRTDLWQPLWHDGIPLMKAGTMISYDHVRESVVAPGFTKEALGERDFYTLIHLGEKTLTDVGLTRDFVRGMVGTPVGSLFLIQQLKGLDMGDDEEGAAAHTEN